METPERTAGIRRRDAVTLDEVIREALPRLLGAARAAGLSAADAEDIAHACILVLLERAESFDGRARASTWLLGVLANKLRERQRKVQREEIRGKVFTVVNAKGGSGATTVAVNVALALQATHGSVALVDIAPLGHAALHMNLKPLFSVADAVRNLHRLDASLLESYMTRDSSGLQVLAGPSVPAATEPTNSEIARLFTIIRALRGGIEISPSDIRIESLRCASICFS